MLFVGRSARACMCIDRTFTLIIVLRCWLHLPDYTASDFIIQYLLMLQHATIFVLYRNYWKSSEAHCGQHNQKVATQTDIQCFFQLPHEPVDERERCMIILKRIFCPGCCRTLFLPAVVVLITRNIGVTWLTTMGQGGGGKTTMGVGNFGLWRSLERERSLVWT
jgi:hypothetical protein